MKRKASNRHSSPTSPRVSPTRFEFSRPGVRDVFLAGSFNDWHPTAFPLVRLDEGRWAKELVLPPGRYEYRFVVDGEWIADPAAAESVPNGCGGFNSVIVVPGLNA